MRTLFRLVLLNIIFLLMTSGIAFGGTDNSTLFNINGFDTSGITAQIIDQTTFVPLRTINDYFDYLKTEWDSKSKTVSVTNFKTNQTLKITLGSNIAHVNDKQISLSSPARILNGVTYVPLRFISENMGLIVYWDQATRYIVIYDVDQKNVADLQSNDLAKARNAALKLPEIALCERFITNQEMLTNTMYYFPYGESKRFIVSVKNLMFYYEVKNNAAWLVWQGIEDQDNKSSKDLIPDITNNVSQEWGIRPSFSSKVSYFWDQYMIDNVQYGIIENGITNKIGEIQQESSNYDVVYNIPGETKTD